MHDFFQFFDSKNQALMLVACVVLVGVLLCLSILRKMMNIESVKETASKPKELDGIGLEVSNVMSKLADGFPFAVFLCGPSRASETASARLREKIHRKLEEKDFKVVLGEDDGLKQFQENRGKDAQTAEVLYVDKSEDCKAVVIVADSVGSYCELGLFNWLYVSRDVGMFSQEKIDFFVILDKKYKNEESYLNCGPIANLKEANSQIDYCDFETFSVENFVKRIEHKRDHRLANSRRRVK